MEITHTESNQHYQQLVNNIGTLLKNARNRVASTTNTILVNTYWQIGQYIVEYEQHGHAKAAYGEELINRLSADLRIKFGKGFSRSNLFTIRQFYLRFPKIQTLSGFLSWSHYIELLKNKLMMEYALHGISNQLFAARYQLYLPNREELQAQLNKLIEND